MEEMINIVKKPGIKNCVRINSYEDIPDFLKEVIKIDGDNLVLDCLEGEEKAPIGSVIAYEKLPSGKMNVWNKANWKETTREVDGVFYEIPKPNKAIALTDKFPEEIKERLGDKFQILPSGKYQIEVSWGLVSCEPYNGYLVIYGEKEDGSLSVNFLTKGTPSFDEYYVLDENGNMKESLQEYDKNLEKNNMLEELYNSNKEICESKKIA